MELAFNPAAISRRAVEEGRPASAVKSKTAAASASVTNNLLAEGHSVQAAGEFGGEERGNPAAARYRGSVTWAREEERPNSEHTHGATACKEALCEVERREVRREGEWRRKGRKVQWGG